MPYSDDPISIVEDLDPEPLPTRGSRQLWEVVLGMILLVAVLVLAGWQWHRQDAQQSSYVAGAQAAARHDWDGAQAFFAAASGYHDADRQAQAAATQVARRDDQYGKAVANKDTSNWAACLKSIQQVIEIQPGYKDSAHIEQEASEQVYRDAMSGTVALRPDANPPGLYYYGESGWIWLPGSDTYSRIRGTGSNDRLVYDVPGDNWDPQPTPTPSIFLPGSPQLLGRRLIALQMSGLPKTVALSFDATLYDRFVWGSDGVWAIRYPGDDPPGFFTPLQSNALDLMNNTVTYQSYDSPITATVHFTAADKSIVMDLDPNSNRYLMATWSGENSMGGYATGMVTYLYLARAGADRQFLYSISGGSFISAHFSPDGKSALLTTYERIDFESEKQTVLLLSLDDKSQPRILAQTAAYMDSRSPDGGPFGLTASFVQSGPYSGNMVVAQYDAVNHYNVSMTDPTTGGPPLASVDVPSRSFLYWSAHEGRNGEALLVGQEGSYSTNPSDPLTAPIWFVVLAPGKSPTVTRLMIDRNTYLDYASIVGNQLVFSTFQYGNNGNNRTVFSFPTARLGVKGERPGTMYSQTGAATGDDLLSYGTHSFGPTLFAYISTGDLHARIYDGSVDVVLGHHITYLYDTSVLYFTQYLLR
jgi:hypothetical protein